LPSRSPLAQCPSGALPCRLPLMDELIQLAKLELVQLRRC
jgi:hypothetical protein